MTQLAKRIAKLEAGQLGGGRVIVFDMPDEATSADIKTHLAQHGIAATDTDLVVAIRDMFGISGWTEPRVVRGGT